jgi:hypothetical protein
MVNPASRRSIGLGGHRRSSQGDGAGLAPTEHPGEPAKPAMEFNFPDLTEEDIRASLALAADRR